MILQTIPQVPIKTFRMNHTKYSMILQTIPTGKRNKSYQIFNDITNNTTGTYKKPSK
jgi:hypothetical protein